MFLKVNRSVGTFVNGVDYMGDNLNIPYNKCGGIIIEVNDSPGLNYDCLNSESDFIKNIINSLHLIKKHIKEYIV